MITQACPTHLQRNVSRHVNTTMAPSAQVNTHAHTSRILTELSVRKDLPLRSGNTDGLTFKPRFEISGTAPLLVTEFVYAVPQMTPLERKTASGPPVFRRQNAKLPNVTI